ncbi:MAG: CocE/NonD family hydrolase [Ginsengibacter sp.]
MIYKNNLQIKESICIIAFTLLSGGTFAQTNSRDSIWIVENYYKIERQVPMRDGIKLFTSIYIPKDSTERHPILITRTPYSCSPYGEGNWPAFWDTPKKYYFREGYIMVMQDVRGRWMSEGKFMDIRPVNTSVNSTGTDEPGDSYDTIDWLVKNIPGNNGKVGVFGVSYPGFYATMAALSNHPALKAVSPQAPVTDWFMGDDWHHNGALMLMDAFNFYCSFGPPRPTPTSKPANAVKVAFDDNYKFYLETGAVKNFNARYFHDTIEFWNELMRHPDLDEWWKARNPRNFVTDVKPAILVVGGLFDAEDGFGAWRLYQAIEQKSKGTDNKLVMGPWSHGQWAQSDGSHLGNIKFGAKTSFWFQDNIELPFFNYYLKGKGNTHLPEATIFISGENQWHKFDQWPPKEKSDKHIYLQQGGKLGWSRPLPVKSSSEYISDPSKPVPYAESIRRSRTTEYMTDDQRFASRRPDVLVFQTDTLSDDLTLAGTVIADLLVSISTTDADFIVKVIDVFPDDFSYPVKDDYPMGGYQMLVRGEVMRGKFRNSFERPEAFTPGKVEHVKFELPDIAHSFRKGHRLMIQVQSSWFPLVDRNPQKFVNINECGDGDFQKAVIKIYHDSKNSSGLLLPVLPNK